MAGSKTASLVGVVLGEAQTPEKAASIAETFGKCPYCSSFTSAGSTALGIFTLPPDQRWWLDEIEKNPRRTLGFDSAEVSITKAIETVSAWTRGGLKPTGLSAPCGAVCAGCPHYRSPCRGCPATFAHVSG